MRITREALAGTLESSDVLVRVNPAGTLKLDVKSSVMGQFGDDIRRVVTDQLDRMGVTEGLVAACRGPCCAAPTRPNPIGVRCERAQHGGPPT